MLTVGLGLLPKKVHQDQEKFCLYCIDKDMQRLLSMFIAFTVVAWEGRGQGREGKASLHATWMFSPNYQVIGMMMEGLAALTVNPAGLLIASKIWKTYLLHTTQQS